MTHAIHPTAWNGTFKNHDLVELPVYDQVVVERRPIRDRNGAEVEGIHVVWITLNNPTELNSYTTNMAKELILALRQASNDRAAVAVVLTGAGTRAFCTGGNTREYADHYAGARDLVMRQADGPSPGLVDMFEQRRNAALAKAAARS